MIRLLEQRPDGICTYEMENDDLKVIVSSYGVTLMEIDMKEPDGSMENVILGYPSIEDYMAKSGTYFGAVVGRTSNRLANGKFVLNGRNTIWPSTMAPTHCMAAMTAFLTGILSPGSMATD